jgi:hypothetical protein
MQLVNESWFFTIRSVVTFCFKLTVLTSANVLANNIKKNLPMTFGNTLPNTKLHRKLHKSNRMLRLSQDLRTCVEGHMWSRNILSPRESEFTTYKWRSCCSMFSFSEKGQNDKQRSTQKTNDQAIQTSHRGELRTWINH